MNSVISSGIAKASVILFACSALMIVGCSHDDAAGDSSDGSSEAIAPDPCDVDAFLASGGNGHDCFPVSQTACFQMCAVGGCTCQRNPAGGDHGLWKCVTDLSCMPDGGPFDDDSGSDDAGTALDADDAG